MSNLENCEPASEKTKLEEVIEKLNTVESFTTDHGSVYTYDEEGHMYGTQSIKGMVQHKLQSKEMQDITVFVDLDDKELESFKETFKPGDKKVRGRIYILEKQPDGNFKLIQNISEVADTDELFLVVAKNNLRVEQKRATLIPTEGYNHFDWRNYEEKGKVFHERSLGGKVTEIVYKNK